MKICALMASLALITISMSGAVAASEIDELRQYCKPDIERLCPGVPFAGGKMKACLQKHQKEMTVGCAQALQKLKNG